MLSDHSLQVLVGTHFERSSLSQINFRIAVPTKVHTFNSPAEVSTQPLRNFIELIFADGPVMAAWRKGLLIVGKSLLRSINPVKVDD